MKHVIAQIFQSYHFTGIETSACDALVDLMQRYIEEIGFYAKSYAQHCGRVDCNVNDIFNGLAELNVSSEALRSHFSHSQEVLLPFERTIPKFPIATKSKKYKLETNLVTPRPNYVSSHFAPFPESHTYADHPIFAIREVELKEIQKKKLKERNQVQSGLSRIQELRGTDKIVDTDVHNFELLTDADFEAMKRASERMEASGLKVEDFEMDFDAPNASNNNSHSSNNAQVVDRYVARLQNEKPQAYAGRPLSLQATLDDDETAVAMDEKQRKRMEYILSMNHEGNTLGEVPAHLLDAPPPSTAPTNKANEGPILIAGGQSTATQQKVFAHNIPTVKPVLQPANAAKLQQMQQQAQNRNSIYK